jgi:hypothetical protein
MILLNLTQMNTIRHLKCKHCFRRSLAWPFITCRWSENGCSDKWGRHEHTRNSTRACIHWLRSDGGDLRVESVTLSSVLRVEETSTEKWAKASDRKVRPVINFFQPKQFLWGFRNPPYVTLNINKTKNIELQFKCFKFLQLVFIHKAFGFPSRPVASVLV